MLYTVYADHTGTGTGELLGEFPTLEEAQDFADGQWKPTCGTSIYNSDGDPENDTLLRRRKPTDPQPQNAPFSEQQVIYWEDLW